MTNWEILMSKLYGNAHIYTSSNWIAAGYEK